MLNTCIFTLFFIVPNNPLGSKIISTSGWVNADTINTLAKQMVQRKFIDLTEKTSYLTLEKTYEEITNENGEVELVDIDLSKIPLNKSIIVWYNEEQRENACVEHSIIDGKEIIRTISKRNTAILKEDENGDFSKIVENEYIDMLVKDSLSIDSLNAIAIFEDGSQINLEYNISLYDQFANHTSKSQVVRIVEKNIYGDQTGDYYVYFLKVNYQPAKVELTIDNENVVVDSSNLIFKKDVKEFKINKIFDQVDEYTFIKIVREYDLNPTIQYFDSSEISEYDFNEVGLYNISIIDRFGNDFTFYIEIK